MACILQCTSSSWNKGNTKKIILIPLILFSMTALDAPSAEGVEVSYLYKLSNFTGTIPYDWVKVSLDNGPYKETYVVSGDSIRIFNDRGMEVYNFGTYDSDLGAIYDIAVDPHGNMIVLSYNEGNSLITLCNYRAEPISKLELKGLPSQYSGYSPNRLFYRDGLLYLVATGAMIVIVTDTDGNFKEAYDLLALIGMEETERENAGIVGFNIDKDGNMLFTVPVIAKAYVMSPARNIREFGKRGSAPGKFGVPGGIVSDNFGNYYVSDTLRCVVMVFNKDFRFLKEFGRRGNRSYNLIGPRDLAIDDNGRLYVTQLRKRGVSVFQITPDQAKGGDV